MTEYIIDGLRSQRNIVESRPIHKALCKRVVKALVELMRECLVEGRPVFIRGFGVLDVRWRKPRTLKVATPGDYTHEAPRWCVYFVMHRDMENRKTQRCTCKAKIPRSTLPHICRLEMINTVKQRLNIHVLDATKYVRAFFYMLPDAIAYTGRVEFEEFGVFTRKLLKGKYYHIHFRAAKSLETDMNPHLEPGVRAVYVDEDEEDAFMEEHDVY